MTVSGKVCDPPDGEIVGATLVVADAGGIFIVPDHARRCRHSPLLSYDVVPIKPWSANVVIVIMSRIRAESTGDARHRCWTRATAVMWLYCAPFNPWTILLDSWPACHALQSHSLCSSGMEISRTVLDQHVVIDLQIWGSGSIFATGKRQVEIAEERHIGIVLSVVFEIDPRT